MEGSSTHSDPQAQVHRQALPSLGSLRGRGSSGTLGESPAVSPESPESGPDQERAVWLLQPPAQTLERLRQLLA